MWIGCLIQEDRAALLGWVVRREVGVGSYGEARGRFSVLLVRNQVMEQSHVSLVGRKISFLCLKCGPYFTLPCCIFWFPPQLMEYMHLE